MPDSNNDILLQAEAQDAKQYRKVLWWVEHRERLGRIGIILLLIFDVCLVLFVAWSLMDVFFLSSSSHRNALIESVTVNQEDLRAYSVARSAAPLEISATRVFAASSTARDFYVELANENTDWWAEFEYQFAYDGGSTPVRSGFILPGQDKPIAELAFTAPSSVSQAQFQITKMSWKRIDHHSIKDYKTWSEDRLRIEILNPTLSQDVALGSTEAKNLFRTSFTAKNNSAFSYREPTFYVLLKRGGSVVGVNRTTIRSLAAGEEAEITVNWFGVIPSASQVEVIPELPIFNKEIYLDLVGSETLDVRDRP